MPPSRSLASYEDIRAVLDTAIRHNQFPVTYTCPTEGQAISWLHRANAYRRLLRDTEEARLKLLPGEGTSPYDHLVFKKNTTSVIIDKRAVGVLFINDTPVEAVASDPEDFILGDVIDNTSMPEPAATTLPPSIEGIIEDDE